MTDKSFKAQINCLFYSQFIFEEVEVNFSRRGTMCSYVTSPGLGHFRAFILSFCLIDASSTHVCTLNQNFLDFEKKNEDFKKVIAFSVYIILRHM